MEKAIEVERIVDEIWNYTGFPFLTIEQMYNVIDKLKKQIDENNYGKC